MATFDESTTSNLSRFGYNFIEDGSTNETIQETGNRLGGIYKVPGMPLVQTLTPRAKESESLNTYSGIFGYSEFPFHTDMAHWHRPPRYMVLRCVVPDEHVSTRLIQAKHVIPRHDNTSGRRALFKPRRRLENKSFLLKVSEPDLFRWDSVFIEPVNQAAGVLKNMIELKLHSVEYNEIRFTTAGQMLIIDNWSVLHGRSHIQGAASSRKIERIYLEKVNL